MKKYLIILCFLFTLPVFGAEEILYEQEINLEQRPSEEQIKATIDKFNFDEKQKEHLIKETKKRIDDMYDKKEKEKQNSCDPLPVVEPNKDGNINIEGFDINKRPVEHLPNKQ